uniref:Single strand DNA binding protein n=1 Tax=Pseudomonas phage HRDY3 TaxID=3236930 RepID=A0AB39CDX9_9VIRU
MGSAVFKGMGSIKTSSRGNDSTKLDELVDMIVWPKNKYFPFRILPIMPLQVRQVWIKLWAGAKGKEKREVNIPRYAIDFDPNDPETPKKGVKCPYMALAEKFKGQKEKPVRASDFWLFNVIDRDMQEEGPPRKASKPTKEEKKTGFKDINSETWTPVRVARLTMTSINRLQELSEENKVKDKKTGKTAQYDVSDAKYGFDVKLKFKPDAAGTDKYTIDKADGPTKLTDEEQGYLVWNLTEELLDASGRMTEKQAREDVKRMEIIGGEDLDDDEDEEEDEKPKKKKAKSTSLDDDEDDEKPKKKKKKSVSFDEDEEDEKPKKKKKKSSDDDEDEKPKKKKKSSAKEEKPSKVKKKSKSKDEDDEKPKKKKASKEVKGGAKAKDKTKKKAGKKKSSWDD